MILYITLFVITIMISSKIRINENGLINNTFNYKRQDLLNKVCLFSIFALLFAVSAFRINTGNDYAMYINKFHDAYYDYYVVTEPGFNFLVKCIYMLFNGEWFIIVFAAFAFFTVAIFIKAIYEQSQDFALSFFLFMSLGFYFQSLNTVRYYLALAIILYSMKYLLSERYISFLALVILAALFHKTAFIVIPLYILAKINWRKWQLVIIGLLSLSGLFFSNFYLKIMLMIYPSYLEEEEYLRAGTVGIFNIVRCGLVIIFALIFYKNAIKDNEKNRFYLYLNLFALILYICFSFVPFLSRIGYYLTVSQIFLLPAVYKSIDNEKVKKYARLAIIVAGIGYFALFLYKAGDATVKILPYSTWLTEEVQILPVDKIF